MFKVNSVVDVKQVIVCWVRSYILTINILMFKPSMLKLFFKRHVSGQIITSI